MITRPKKCVFLLLIGALLINVNNAAAEHRWFASFYGGQATFANEKDVLTFDADYIDSYFATVTLGKELWQYKHFVSLEAEGQFAQHWDFQKHSEFNGVLLLRWLLFPWDDVIDTSLAIGNGLSYATEIPEIEKQKLENTSNLLWYLSFELSLGLSSRSDWNLFLRLNHRSGVFGLISDVSGGSNAVGVGLRYYF